MLHPQPLLTARVLARINRFTVAVQPEGGDADVNPPVRAYLSNTGNLASILPAGAEVLVAPVDTPGTKLRFRLVLARQWGSWVAVDSGLASRLVEEALATCSLPGFEGWQVERREPAVDGGRLDLLLTREDRRLWMEVKCTTLVRNGIARFPDPATARGARHLRTLAQLARQGEEAAVCFMAQRPDARALCTLASVDPRLTAALADARAAGVRCHAYRCRVSRRGIWLAREIPVLG